MITNPVPPDIRPTIIDLDRRIESLERTRAQILAGVTRPQNLSHSISGEVASASGVTSGYQRLGTGVSTPSVQVITGGIVVITMTAHVRAGWSGVGDAAAVGAMNFIVDGAIPNESIEDRAMWGIYETFKYRDGEAYYLGTGRTVSVTRTVALAQGPHKISTDYIYWQQTGNIWIEWSHRSITVETR